MMFTCLRYGVLDGAVLRLVEAVRVGGGQMLSAEELRRDRICEQIAEMAVVYDGCDGQLFAHGVRDQVEDFHARSRSALRERIEDPLTPPEVADVLRRRMDDLEIVIFTPTPEALDELNACIATVGRAVHFHDRIEAVNAGLRPRGMRH